MSNDWKESKLVIAASSSVAAALFVITIYATVVIPVYEEKFSYKLDLVSDELSALDKTREQVQNLNELNKELKSENESLKVSLKHYQDKNPFKGKSAFPYGLGKINKGMDISSIKNEYPIKNIVIKDDWVDADLDSEFFKSLVIYTKKIKEGEHQVNGHFIFFFDQTGEKTVRNLLSLLKLEFGKIDYEENNRNDIYSVTIKNLNGFDIHIDAIAYKISPSA